ncbi:MAG: hypothetical protein QOF38_4734, partial [Pseudonocardiales bacterium]|nr:hypothetical protein [Pseudonocardiales bacterium]
IGVVLVIAGITLLVQSGLLLRRVMSVQPG